MPDILSRVYPLHAALITIFLVLAVVDRSFFLSDFEFRDDAKAERDGFRTSQL